MGGTELLDDVRAETAIAEAHRRWGPSGAISFADRYRLAQCLVGELIHGRFWIRGRGSTWNTAFADADARAVDGSRRRAAR